MRKFNHVRSSYAAMPILLLILILGIMGGTCNYNLLQPGNFGPFRLSISVRDQLNRPVAGLRVSAWNLIRIPITGTSGLRSEMGTLSTSVIGYALPLSSHVDLVASELNGTILDTLVSGEYPAGYYRVAMFVHLNAGCRVLKCRLHAGSFRDSIYAVLWQPDPAQSILGYTAPGGTFIWSDSLSFPNLFPLPPMILTSLDGPNVLGTFSIPDSVAICLVDTATSKSQIFRMYIHHGTNDVLLNWNPSESTELPDLPKQPMFTTTVTSDTGIVVVPIECSLDQNYPNPFN